MILAGDIGGTKTVLGLYEETDGGVRQLREGVFPSRDHASLEEIIGKFLQGQPSTKLRAGCFGVAGAVVEGKVKTTNLPWQLEETALAATIGAPRVKLLNDLEAAAFGMLFLKPEEMCVINPGTQPKRKGNIAVIAAGTGLGEAMLYWDGQRYHPIASEGGHASYAPQIDLEIELLKYLRGKCGGHVSYERVLSGPGFFSIYTFLRDIGFAAEPPWLTERLKTGDKSAVVTQVGLAGEDPLCTKTVELFMFIYGAEAANLALKCVAVSGVYVGGGIAPKMLPAVQGGAFMRGFTHKGRFADLLRSVEVSVSLNPRAPLIGAAHYALRL